VRHARIRLEPDGLAKGVLGVCVPALLAAGAALLKKLVEIYAS
jgi:hypothetical protein